MGTYQSILGVIIVINYIRTVLLISLAINNIIVDIFVLLSNGFIVFMFTVTGVCSNTMVGCS